MKHLLASLVICCSFATLLCADTIILRDGSSYSGRFEGGATITFTDSQGIQYQFPRGDVQSLVLTSSLDTVTLRNGKSYSGHFTGSNPISFTGPQGIKYEFPVRDVDSLVFSSAGTETASVPQNARLVPTGTDLSVRTDEEIDSSNSQPGQLYRGAITESVLHANGNVVNPAGSRAELMIRQISTGGAVHSPELALDLDSVVIDGKRLRVVTSDVDESIRIGIGKYGRTAEFLGGGAAIGALLGGIFGGGKGAGIGAAAGGGGGFLTQVFTRGKQVRIPAESVMRFRLEKPLVLQPET